MTPSKKSDEGRMFIGRALHELFRKSGKSASDLATSVGVSRPTVSQWRNDHDAPHPRNLAAIAAFFGVPVEHFTEAASGPAGKVREPDAPDAFARHRSVLCRFLLDNDVAIPSEARFVMHGGSVDSKEVESVMLFLAEYHRLRAKLEPTDSLASAIRAGRCAPYSLKIHQPDFPVAPPTIPDVAACTVPAKDPKPEDYGDLGGPLQPPAPSSSGGFTVVAGPGSSKSVYAATPQPEAGEKAKGHSNVQRGRGNHRNLQES